MDDLSHGVHLGLLLIDISLSASFSLKDKRRVVRSVIERLRANGSLSVTEAGRHDAHTRALLAVAFVSGDRAHAENVLQGALRQVEARDELVVVRWQLEWR